ncbi:restriction endonuclease subunit S [Cronbergia sp. UHCC 0137]|uniref:restriction endonuclease subunit S n=1 Tax=Cronbergia sp. UHCC 0137 TaxID=3110239 RepID=UPI002B201458|nr:restriction endonuclease subunit S [Cronbergia sp. UHCC 0137]MEA5617067.1 restriction endonuclease subunit S [Cronbergia sp. UHCC 0137]
MSEWKEFKLNDLCKIGSSKRIFSSEYVVSGIPFFRSKEIIEKSFGDSISEPLFISEKRFREIEKNFGSPNEGDILISSVGARSGIPYRVKKEDGKFYFKDGNLIWIKDFTENINSVFLLYWLKSNIGQENLESIMIGSAQPALTIDGISNLFINLPNIKLQKSIADVLSCLDAKIENLRRQNETLEQIAQTLFKHWFIDFEFPNADGKPYKSSGGAMVRSELGEIPEGWRVLTLEQICKTIYRYPQFYGMEKVDSGVPVIRGEHLLNTGRISVDFSDYWFVKEEYSAKFPKTILEEFDVVLSVRGSVGNYSVVGKKHIHAQISPNTIRLSANPDILKKTFLYPCLKVNKFKQKLLSIVSSSAVPAINAGEFKTFEFAIPAMSVQDMLSDVFKDLYKKIDINEHQIQTLTKTRDTLLPKLMSGQLRVKE